MKRLVYFFCPKCDKSLSSDEKFSGETARCPRCGKEFKIPSKAEAEKEKFLREVYGQEEEKYAGWLKSRLKIIRSSETKYKKSCDPDSLIPPWMKDAVKRAKKSAEENPLKDTELRDMDGSGKSEE
jgi:Zn-finger nucleic acid-binding protein